MKKILITAVVAFSLTACQKDETTTPCTFDSSNFLGDYIISGATIQDNAQAIPVDDYVTWSDCEKDDLYSIKADSTITFSEGATSCDPPTDSATYEWRLNCNQFYLVGHSTIYTVSEISSMGFKLTCIDPNDNKIHTYTYTRQ